MPACQVGGCVGLVCSRGLVSPRAQGCPVVQTAAERCGKHVRIGLLIPLMVMRCLIRAVVILAPFGPMVGLIGEPEAVLGAHAVGVVR